MTTWTLAASLTVLAAMLPDTIATAQTGYKYRDANGQWVFTDTAPPPSASAEQGSFSLGHQSETLQNTVERTDTGHTTQFTAVNTCLCIATFTATIVHSDDPAVEDGSVFRKILQSQTREPLVSVANAGRENANLKYAWLIALGSPEAKHHPSRPYRVPFAVGSTYMVSQAYPQAYTHNTPDSRYAVDIALPDGTPVYAAREGMIINLRHDAFRGGAAAAMMDQANMVEVLHDDGTIAIYGHLHWDSIRVRIGQQVTRGQYLADSGNTGFSTGPHLHFAVFQNQGFSDVSVPIEFAGPSGVAVTPVTRQPLTAY